MIEIQPFTSEQFVNDGKNDTNAHMIGLVATSSSTGRRWRMRYSFVTEVQLSSLTVEFHLHSATPKGKMTVGLTDDISEISPKDVALYAENRLVTASFEEMVYPGKTYYLWLNYAGSFFEYCNVYEEDVIITAVPAASVLKAEDGVLGEEQTLTIEAGSDEFEHDVQYRVGSASGVVAEKTTDATIVWTPPLELAEQQPNGKSVECVFTIITYTGGVENGRLETHCRYEIPESCAPGLSCEILAENGRLPSLFDGLYVQGRSKVRINLHAEPRYGAEIVERFFSVGSETAIRSDDTYTSSELPNSGNVAVKVRITDSRGYSKETSSEISVQEYTGPTVVPAAGKDAIVCARANADGVIDDAGLHLRIQAGKKFSTVSGVNRCELRYRIKKDDGGFGEWVTLLEKGSEANDIGITTSDALLATSVYVVEINAVDDIGDSSVLQFRLPTLDVPLHLGAGGRNIGIGRFCDYGTAYRCDVGWDVQLDKGVRIFPFPGEEKETLKALGWSETASRILVNNVVVAPADFQEYEVSGFPYRASVSIDGAEEGMVPDVVFAAEDAMSGNFAPVADSFNGGVYIYSASIPGDSITIPTILLWR